MTDAERKELDRIDRERREKEYALLLLLVGLMSTARSHAVHAARIGADPGDAARLVIAGDVGGHFIGATPVMVAARMQAFESGFGAGARLVTKSETSVAPDATAIQKAQAIFQEKSADYASKTADKIVVKIRAVEAKALGPTEEIEEIRKVFQDVQVTRKQHTQLATEVERAVVDSFGAGMKTAYDQIGGPDLILRHYSILDQHTTHICEDRDMLTLYADDPYWDGNTPELHWGCRSTVLPAEPGAVLSNRYPTVPVMPGFGSGIFASIGRALQTA